MLGKKLWLSVALFVLMSASFFVCGRAEDAADGEIVDEGDTEPEEDMLINQKTDDDENESTGRIGPSPDAQIIVLFTSPVNTRDLVAGQIVKVLIGFANKGEKDFIVTSSETSFRYPMDFNYHIQNFSAVHYNQVVQPKKESTFDYSFIPADAFIGRPLGLTINLHYTDTDGTLYTNAAYNETVNIVEDESGFNTETGFLYIILAGMVVLILLAGQHYLSKFTKKPSYSYYASQEVGTNSDEIDYEWIPRTNFLEKKSPKPRRPAAAKAN